MSENAKTDQVQGEGNYDASRNYRHKTEDFIESGKVEEAARNARPRSAAEAAELERAEQAGRERAAGEDSGVRK
jgi:hypothetical protein